MESGRESREREQREMERGNYLKSMIHHHEIDDEFPTINELSTTPEESDL